MTIRHDFDDRQLGTILAALRVYQETLGLNGGTPPSHVADVATASDIVEPLSVDEIDALCEDINHGQAATVAAPAGRYDAWDESFARTIIRHEGTETRYVPVVDRHLPFAVGQIPDEGAEAEALAHKHDHRAGALLSGTPSLALTTPGDIRHYLTWEEAYNLGAALIDVALVSLHG